MGRRKIKDVLKHSTNNSQIHFVQRILGKLICTLTWKKLEVLWKIFTLSWPQRFWLCWSRFSCTKIWRRWTYTRQRSTSRKWKLWWRKYRQQINSCQALGMLLEQMLFRLSKMYAHYHWKQITSILNPYYMPDYFFLPESASFGESPMVNFIVWKFVKVCWNKYHWKYGW